MSRVSRVLVLLGLPLAIAGPVGTLVADEGEERHITISDCQFQSAPEEVLTRESRIHREVYTRAAAFGKGLTRSAASAPVPASSIPRRNVVDDLVFGRLERLGVPAARLTTDEEFVRRIHLDLTGRIPSPQAIREFVASDNSNKRDELIERLLNSSEFVDRWTLWMGDWLQVTAFPSTAIQPQINGRNAFHTWLRKQVADRVPLKDIAWVVVTARVGGARPTPAGNPNTNTEYWPQIEQWLQRERPTTNYDEQTGYTNFALMSQASMGPAQDTYDLMLYRTASTFLGLGHYDCLLCHDGRGHLDNLSLWGRRGTRVEAQRMAAFFARLRFARLNISNNPGPPVEAPQSRQFVNSYHVEDATSGEYLLNTNSGNRPLRLRLSAQSPDRYTPVYRDGAAPKQGQNWREAFAENMINDRMFARNLANRVFKQVFNLGLVEPVDTLDPLRLDPKSPPPAPWSLQAAHPELLEELADQWIRSNYGLREFIGLLVRSSAYQLASQYDGEWKLEYVPLFARHYPRRLEAEEVHDAITAATGVKVSYTIQGFSEPVDSALKFPDTSEPRSNGGMVTFLNAFFRGNRDTTGRSQSGSILQQLNLMNNTFVLDRIRAQANANNGGAVMALVRMAGNDEPVEELFLRFLGRRPTDAERATARTVLERATTPAARNAAFEDLAWACLNKTEFLFSY